MIRSRLHHGYHEQTPPPLSATEGVVSSIKALGKVVGLYNNPAILHFHIQPENRERLGIDP